MGPGREEVGDGDRAVADGLAAGVGLPHHLPADDPAARHRERWDRFASSTKAGGAALRDRAVQGARSASEAVEVRRAARFTRSEEDTRIEQLERLARLREAGLLDEEELRTEKARVLGNGTQPAEPGPVVTN